MCTLAASSSESGQRVSAGGGESDSKRNEGRLGLVYVITIAMKSTQCD